MYPNLFDLMLKIITVGLKFSNDFCFGFERFSLEIFGPGDENKDALKFKTIYNFPNVCKWGGWYIVFLIFECFFCKTRFWGNKEGIQFCSPSLFSGLISTP